MSKRKPTQETVLTAYAEGASGPGWANQPIWVIVRDGNGALRQECIQPERQTAEMLTLYRISQSAHLAMTAAVERIRGRRRR